jgi:excinuclease ABC subunit C
MDFKEVYQNLPTTPGVYIYKNSQREIIYVGKAINLRRRVSQYFQRDDALGLKTIQLVSQIADISYKNVGSEIEALILEASLIKKYKPKYNSQLKDDRSYIYICLTKEKIPRLFASFRSNLPKDCLTYGPFPNSRAVKSLLKSIRHIFPFRSLANHSPKPCLYCHLDQCPGPNPDPKIYRQNIRKIKKILSGDFVGLQRQLKKEITLYSKIENYEAALESRNDLASIEYIVSGWNQLSTLYDSVTLPDDLISSGYNELFSTLSPYFPQLKSINRIECFDISNLGSHYFVGSMSVYKEGTFSKGDYRKFKIYSKVTPDDQFMIKEVVWRRLKHPQWGIPDLIVVDGGKPQISAATEAINLHPEFNSGSVNLIGLAKKFETIVIKTPDKWVEINLPPHSHALHILQLIRNEAHRFANAYRKELMKKRLLNP